MSPKVSVVIPAYNRAKIIPRAIESVLSQSMQDFELLIVDDGSADALEEVLSKYQGSRIRLLKHEGNRGASQARNTGIQHAQGEYVAFLDSDDEWLPQKLELQLEHFSGANSNVAASCTDHYLISGDQRTYSKLNKSDHWLCHFLFGCDVSPGTTLMVRKAVYSEIGLYDTTFPRLEDQDWLIRFAKKYDLGIVNVALANIYVHPLINVAAFEQAVLMILERYREEIQQCDKPFQKAVYSKNYLDLAVRYLQQGNQRKGLSYALRGLFYNPIQRPGYYLQLLDGMIGTRFYDRLKNSRS